MNGPWFPLLQPGYSGVTQVVPQPFRLQIWVLALSFVHMHLLAVLHTCAHVHTHTHTEFSHQVSKARSLNLAAVGSAAAVGDQVYTKLPLQNTNAEKN